jgi:hypothetical protein
MMLKNSLFISRNAIASGSSHQTRSTGASSLLKNCFAGESAAKSTRSRSRIAGISDDTPRFGDAELVDLDRSQPE